MHFLCARVLLYHICSQSPPQCHKQNQVCFFIKPFFVLGGVIVFNPLCCSHMSQTTPRCDQPQQHRAARSVTLRSTRSCWKVKAQPMGKANNLFCTQNSTQHTDTIEKKSSESKHLSKRRWPSHTPSKPSNEKQWRQKRNISVAGGDGRHFCVYWRGRVCLRERDDGADLMSV